MHNPMITFSVPSQKEGICYKILVKMRQVPAVRTANCYRSYH